MKRIAYTTLCACLFAANLYAEQSTHFKDQLIPAPPFKQNYIAFGGGGAFPMKNSYTSDDSDVWILGSLPPGQSFFFALNNVTWENTYKNGYELNLALGHRFDSHWAGEIEGIYENITRQVDGSFTWTISDFPTGENQNAVPDLLLQEANSKVNFYSVLANAIYNFSNHSAFTPFVGIGLGAGFFDSGETVAAGGFTVVDRGATYNTPTLEFGPAVSGTVFAWQFKTGVSYDINETVGLVLQYRLIGTTELNTSSSQINTNPGRALNETAYFNIPVNTVSGILVNGVDLNIRFNV